MPSSVKVDVNVDSEPDGTPVPKAIVWTDGTSYPIERVIHVTHPEDLITTFTILIGNRQRKLYYNGCEWRISRPLTTGGKPKPMKDTLHLPAALNTKSTKGKTYARIIYTVVMT